MFGTLKTIMDYSALLIDDYHNNREQSFRSDLHVLEHIFEHLTKELYELADKNIMRMILG